MNAKGQGGVYVNKRTGGWFARVPVGKTENGNPRYKRLNADTKAKAEKLRLQLLVKRENQVLIAGPRQTFRQFTDWYYEFEARNTIRETTAYKNKNLLKNHAFPVVGHRPLSDITSQELTEMFGRLRKKYTACTVNQLRLVMSSIFTNAIKHDLLQVNPVTKTSTYKREEGEKSQVQNPWTQKECEKVFQSASGTPMDLFVHLGLLTGMRRGEILGLHWEDIDFTNNSLRVERTLIEGTRPLPDGTGLTKPVYNPPKTSSSRREIVMPAQVIDALQRHRIEQDLARIAAGNVWIETDCVFTNSLGGELYPGNFARRFTRFLKPNGIRVIRVHDMRHTFAVSAFIAGVDIATISQTLGHSSVDITKSIYAKHVPRLSGKATSAVAEMFFPDRPQPALREGVAKRGAIFEKNTPHWARGH